MKVTADRVYQQEIMEACHEEIGSLHEARMHAGHFGRVKVVAKVAARW